MLAVYTFAYFITMLVVLWLLKRNREKTYPLPNIEYKDKTLCFFSNKRHKIFVGDCRVLQLGKKVFLKREKRIVQICNIANISLKNGWLYFDALGCVDIFIGNKKWLRYVQINICSNQFDLTQLKQKAGKEVLNNLFEMRACHNLLRYVRFVKYVLKIDFSSTGLQVKQNAYGLGFCLDYNINGKQKRIFFNQSV